MWAWLAIRMPGVPTMPNDGISEISLLKGKCSVLVAAGIVRVSLSDTECMMSISAQVHAHECTSRAEASLETGFLLILGLMPSFLLSSVVLFCCGIQGYCKGVFCGRGFTILRQEEARWLAGWVIELLVLNRWTNWCLAHSLCKMDLMMMLPGVPLTKLLCRTNEIFFYPFYQIMSLRTYKTSAILHCIGVKSTSLP